LFQPGDTVDDRYDILGHLGQGGMAYVFKARDRHLERDVALKVLRPHLTETDSERFRREIRALASLNHPGIVNIFDLGLGQHVYFAMELISGGPITDLGPLEDDAESLDTLLTASITVAEALGYVHKLGMVHRDLTPRNILLSGQNQPKVMDFGLVQLTETSQQLTRTGFTLGTPQYMAPEQARGDLTGLATDLYAFGVVLYRTLTGVSPFEAENDQAILYQHVYNDPVPVQDLNPLIPDALARLVSALLEKEPAARPPSGEVVADVLRSIRHSALRRSTHLPLGGASRKAVYPSGPSHPAGLTLDWRVHLPDGPQWPGGIGAAEGLILLGLRDDRVAVLHPADGSEVASFAAPDEVSTAPIYAHGRLYLVSRDGSLQARSWPAGQLLWDEPGLDISGILPYHHDLLVTSGRGTLDLLAPGSGVLWSYDAGAPAATPPSLHRGQAMFHTHDGWLHAVDALTGKGRFKVETGTLAAAPAAADGVLFLTVRSGELHALDMNSKEVLWSHDLPGEVFGSPAIWQGRIYLGSWGRKLHCLSFSTGDTLWVRDLPSAVTASPVLAGGTVYVACEGGQLLAFSARTGQQLWQDQASHGPIQASPLLLNEHLIVAALDGTVSAYHG
jgi:serine/threonine-protein kinase